MFQNNSIIKDWLNSYTVIIYYNSFIFVIHDVFVVRLLRKMKYSEKVKKAEIKLNRWDEVESTQLISQMCNTECEVFEYYVKNYLLQ